MKERRSIPLVLLVLVPLLLVVSACGPSATEEVISAPEEVATELPEGVQPTEQAAVAEEPVVLRIGGFTDIDCWNGWTCPSMWQFGLLLGDPIAGHGPLPGCPGVPLAVESWEPSNGYKTWTLHLAEGNTNSNGTLLDAENAAEYLRWFQTIGFSIFPEITYMEEVKAIDQWTLQYTTSVPISNSPDYDFQYMGFGDAEYNKQFDSTTIWTAEEYPPISSGPYGVTDYKQGSYVIFDARPDYYRGKPPIDRIVYQIYANMDALVNAFIAGEIDMTGLNMPPSMYDTLKNVPNTVVEEKAPGNIHRLVFNMYSSGKTHVALTDPAVREAIDYAVNKQQIIDVALLGHGILCPTGWGCGPNYVGEINPDLEVYPYDPGLANQILDEHGYVDSDKDGIRETAQGAPLEFRLYYATDVPDHATMAESIASWLGDIGISVTTEAQERTAFEQLILGDRDFDMALWVDFPDVDPAGMDFQLACWSADAGINGSNESGYCNPEVDELVNAYWFSDDLDTRLEPMYRAQQIVHDDRPYIFLAGQNGIQAYRSERFEFPLNSCDNGLGLWSTWSLLQAVVK